MCLCKQHKAGTVSYFLGVEELFREQHDWLKMEVDGPFQRRSCRSVGGGGAMPCRILGIRQVSVNFSTFMQLRILCLPRMLQWWQEPACMFKSSQIVDFRLTVGCRVRHCKNTCYQITFIITALSLEATESDQSQYWRMHAEGFTNVVRDLHINYSLHIDICQWTQ